MKPKDDVVEWQLAGENQNTRLGGSMTVGEVEKMKQVLTENKDLCTWIAEDMPGINPWVMSHKLLVCKEAQSVSQKRRREAVVVEVQKLLDVRFIREIQYTMWLANVVLVKSGYALITRT